MPPHRHTQSPQHADGCQRRTEGEELRTAQLPRRCSRRRKEKPSIACTLDLRHPTGDDRDEERGEEAHPGVKATEQHLPAISIRSLEIHGDTGAESEERCDAHRTEEQEEQEGEDPQIPHFGVLSTQDA